MRCIAGKNHYEKANQSRFSVQDAETTNDVESGSTRLFLQQPRIGAKLESVFGKHGAQILKR
jgi:hypothetical protein